MLPPSAHDHLLRLAKGEGVPLGVLNYTILQLLRPCLSVREDSCDVHSVRLSAPWHAPLFQVSNSPIIRHQAPDVVHIAFVCVLHLGEVGNTLSC